MVGNINASHITLPGAPTGSNSCDSHIFFTQLTGQRANPITAMRQRPARERERKGKRETDNKKAAG